MEGRVFQVVRVFLPWNGEDGVREIVTGGARLSLCAGNHGTRTSRISRRTLLCKAYWLDRAHDFSPLPSPSDPRFSSFPEIFLLKFLSASGGEDDLLTCALKSVFNGLDGEDYFATICCR